MKLAKEYQLAHYEGLIFSTAKIYEPFLDDDMDDIMQDLRVKAWIALEAFDPVRDRLKGVESFVFSCVYNRVKDMLKSQSRRNQRRNGTQLHIEDVAGELTDSFERRYMAVTEEEVYADVFESEGLIPDGLTSTEREVVVLLVLDFNQAEIARRLDLSTWKVRATHRSVREKLADLQPLQEAA